jgi:D-alanine-D-alanine ligase
MVKNHKHIEIVRPTIKGLSSMSSVSCDSILAVLNKHFDEVGVTVVNNWADLEVLIESCPDLVFLGMESIPTDPTLGLADSNRVWLSDVLDNNGITYTGSSQKAHELERNKPLAKQRVLDAKLKTSAFCVAKQSQLLDRTDVTLDFPLFVKPTNRGGGLGVDSDSVVHDFEQLRIKVHSITTTFKSDALIEEYLPGREFSVAVLKDKSSAGYLAMPIELVAPVDKNGSRLLSGQVKSENVEQVLEVTDLKVRSKVITLALAVFEALDARDYGRIDIRLDATGTPHFLEANLIPSLISGYGSFPKACLLNVGLDYEPMIMTIVNLALARQLNEIIDVHESITTSNSILRPSEVMFGVV